VYNCLYAESHFLPMDVAAGDEVAMAYNSTPSSAGTQVVQNFTLVLRGTTDFAPR